MQLKRILTLILSCLLVCAGGIATADIADDHFHVDLPCDGQSRDNDCEAEDIEIPNGRPIYALLVSGYHQNKNLDMFHWYNFAKCLQEKGAYVHYSWWNNLLAPYMEKPLHNENSVPSFQAVPYHDAGGFTYGAWPCLTIGGCYPNKALPAEDYQFQADAKKLLEEIRVNNPDSAIILVGHSMGGDAIVRLADSMPPDFDIDLLAPIDPVGNRTCVPNYKGFELGPFTAFCNGTFNFTRWRATRYDWMDDFWDFLPWYPPQRAFGSNIKYLYHRWQQEFGPPFDYSCPTGGNELYWPCTSFYPDENEYLFDMPITSQRVTSITGGSNNVQSMVDTNLFSGMDVPVEGGNLAGGLDGHGEIVGFRGALLGDALYDFEEWGEYILGDIRRMFAFESYPLALEAPEYWPSLDIERSFDKEEDRANVRDLRISLLKEWETNPNYLDDYDWAPKKPEEYCQERELEGDYCTYCMVSGDLCTILKTKLELPGDSAPVADAGSDQIVECSGPNGTQVTLDGSASFAPDDDPLTYTWVGPFGTMMGEVIHPVITVGTHSITLTVDDGRGKTDSDIVNVTVLDSTPPSLSVSLSPNVLWPPNHKMVSISASIQASDTCDGRPKVELVSIISNEADNGSGDGNTTDDIQGADFGTDDREFLLRAERTGRGIGRIYMITYGTMDASGNATETTNEVIVLHDSGK